MPPCHRHHRPAAWAAALLLALGWCAGAGAAEHEWHFESDTGGWTALGCSIQRTDKSAKEGDWSLAVSREFPGTATIQRAISLDVNKTPRVSYDLFVPAAAGPTLKTLVFLKNKDGLWYQCVRHRPLYPGRWSRVTFDLSPRSSEVEPLGHFRRWSNGAAAEMTAIGIKVFSRRAFAGPVLIDGIRLETVEVERPPLAITDFRPSAAEVPRFSKFELSFDINRSFGNPFDPDRVVVDAEFTGPKGRKLTAPGFYFQDFVRVDRVTPMTMQGRRRGRRQRRGPTKTWRLLEDFVPVGTPCWKVRFAPDTPGRYSYILTVTDRTGSRPETLKTQPRTFRCVSSRNRGYVRVARDRRHFEFSTGEPFFPLGHNVHASNDVSDRNCRLLGIKPQDDRGTRAYEAIFGRMARGGENVAEVWMASWSLDIEWTARWKHYFGLGRYNMHHAWKLDHILSLAEKHDLYIHLVLENHGKISTWVDPEWQDNPYNEENGGFLASCRDYFSRPDAREQTKKKFRYIIARWGHSPRIMGIELVSELDLTGEAARDHRGLLDSKVEWHREMGRYLKQIDHDRHLLTTHYSVDYNRVQKRVAELPEIDYIAVDAYREKGGIVPLLYGTARALRRYNKPIWVTEYGGSPSGASLPRLEADLHAGIWAGYMLDHVGTPLLWWFMYIDKHKKYGHYKALANYARGEDRRNRGLKSGAAQVTGAGAADLRAVVLKNDRSAYAWVYDMRAAREVPRAGRETVWRGLSVQLTKMRPGAYKVEFWHTLRGAVIGTQTIAANGGTIVVPLPEFRNDIALKVKPLQVDLRGPAPKDAEPEKGGIDGNVDIHRGRR